MMKITALNQTIEISNSMSFIPFPYYDINHSSNSIFVSKHISIDNQAERELINQVIFKGVIDILNFKYQNLNAKDNIVLNWIISKIDLTKELYDVVENKKIKHFTSK